MTTTQLDTTQSAMKTIAENIILNTQGPVLIHFWGFEDDQAVLDGFLTSIHSRNNQCFGVLLTPKGVKLSTQNNTFTPMKLYGDFPWENACTIIDLCKYAPTSLASELEGESRALFVSFMRNLFSRATAPGKTFLQIRVPSEVNAEEYNMTYAAYEDAWLSQVQVDYALMKEQGAALSNQLSPWNQFTLTTGGSHTLTFEVSNRKWFLDVGDGDFPAGEVYIAPIENSVNGSFVATRLFWEGYFFENVVLEFSSGVLANCSVPQILDDLRHAPGDALRFAEFGLGINPGLNKIDGLTGCALFDEKMLDTCHIAIGMNTLFGGTNESPVHIDFVAADYTLSYH